MTKSLLLLFIPFFFILSSCNNDDDAQPSVEEYLQGEWRETKVSVKVTDQNGGIVADHESASTSTYSLAGDMLYMSNWPEYSWNFTIEEENGKTFIHARYGVNYSFRYAITIVSEKEMIWTLEAMQPGPEGELNHRSVRKHYLQRK